MRHWLPRRRAGPGEGRRAAALPGRETTEGKCAAPPAAWGDKERARRPRPLHSTRTGFPARRPKRDKCTRPRASQRPQLAEKQQFLFIQQTAEGGLSEWPFEPPAQTTGALPLAFCAVEAVSLGGAACSPAPRPNHQPTLCLQTRPQIWPFPPLPPRDIEPGPPSSRSLRLLLRPCQGPSGGLPGKASLPRPGPPSLRHVCGAAAAPSCCDLCTRLREPSSALTL